MPKRKEEPARPYHDVKWEYEASRKAFDEAATALYSTADSIARLMPEGDVSRGYLLDACAKFRAAAYGEI
jgi:hypothetical protein